MSKYRKFIALLIGFVFATVALASCSDEESKTAGNSVKDQQSAVAISLERQNKTQPLKVYDTSQIKQVLLDVEDIQANGAISTTRFYLEGIGLVGWCPSIGSPVPASWQLSPSKQWVDLPGDHTKEWKEVDQAESTGVYVGPTSGTWTICVDDNGKKFGQLWEGYTMSTIGVIKGLDPSIRVQLDQATYAFGEVPGKKKGN